MMGMDDLIPPTRTVAVGGRDVLVEVLRMRQLPGFGKAIAEPLQAIVQGDYLTVIMQWPEQVTEALAIATGLDRAFLSNLRPDEFVQLATAVFEVNLDFFARAVLPAATAMGATVRAAMLSTSQPGSSGSGTATPTSLN
jgi:hypothetical protein